MKLGHVIIYVPDVPAAIAFYERAFALTCRFVHESDDYGELATGDTTLAFASEGLSHSNGVDVRPNRAGEQAAGIEIALVTDTLDAAFERAVAAGAVVVKPPTTKPWGQVVAWVRDPNGVLVELCTPVGA